MRRVRFAEATSKVLGAEHLEMVVDGHFRDFHMEIWNESGLMAARGNTEGAILHLLKFTGRGSRGSWRPNWSRVVKSRRNIRLPSLKHHFFTIAPTSARESAKNVQLVFAAFGDASGVSVEMKVRVKRDTENFRLLVERDLSAIDVDARMSVGLTGFVRRK